MLTKEEVEKRTQDVKAKGVFFYTSTVDNQPLTREESQHLITENMDAIIGNKELFTPEQTNSFLRKLFSK